ncbi:hypothetical protein P4H39_25150 [Paenibacillus lautus]|uniref:hypothetical protein n=1 Tax=Paenibacillus lautus TaxID=1401 RepID=UPI002DBE86CD|nr:hypothetical protein [Paenibacillus lautus]MEC0205902.1 hypothetical protein [Paenibacillus lautus]
MVMIILGVIMIVLGLYDYKNPNLKFFKFLSRTPKNDTNKQEIRSNGESGIIGGIIFIVIGVIALLLRD